VREDRRPVKPDRQVVKQQPGDVLVQVLRRIPVGQHLVVGDQHEHFGAEIGEQHGRERSGSEARKFDDSDSGKWSSTHRPPPDSSAAPAATFGEIVRE